MEYSQPIYGRQQCTNHPLMIADKCTNNDDDLSRLNLGSSRRPFLSGKRSRDPYHEKMSRIFHRIDKSKENQINILLILLLTA